MGFIIKGEEVELQISHYVDNGSLAILLQGTDGIPYGTVSVNLSVPLTNERCCFIDTNNMGSSIEGWLFRNKIARPTGRTERSGFCIYPEYEVYEDVIKKYSIDDNYDFEEWNEPSDEDIERELYCNLDII